MRWCLGRRFASFVGVALPELVGHGEGAIRDGDDPGSAEETVPEIYRLAVAHVVLRDDVADAGQPAALGYVALPCAGEGREIGHARRLEEAQVDSVVDVAVGVEVAVADLLFLDKRGSLHGR